MATATLTRATKAATTATTVTVYTSNINNSYRLYQQHHQQLQVIPATATTATDRVCRKSFAHNYDDNPCFGKPSARTRTLNQRVPAALWTGKSTSIKPISHLSFNHFHLCLPFCSDSSLLAWTSISLLLTTAMAVTNFFQFKSPSVWNNEAWGRYCISFADYTPTCGWKLIVSSSYTLTSVSAWDSTQQRLDAYTYLITNVNYNADLLTNPPNSCGDITLGGSFGNTEPEVFITWYCVCVSNQLGCQEVPYQTVAPWDATTTTTAPPPTTESTTTTTTAAAAAVAVKDLYTGYNVINPTKIFLRQEANTCYLGTSFTSIPQINHVIDCAVKCRDLRDCASINFRQNSGVCDLVLENPDLNPSSLGPTSGCAYWKVVWKA
ncbi:hypothetical protein PoB_005589300 [Plakobranchus ocellatus]|uniref:Apple domain-containing protein n=1 Tax=Plakobranchus ocellatus TaxID=259542 RepID=A0AAV4CD77_9GAST|nr:hypothetical protein PoB_005589300 [Plakobranchus ocellatus]